MLENLIRLNRLLLVWVVSYGIIEGSLSLTCSKFAHTRCVMLKRRLILTQNQLILFRSLAMSSSRGTLGLPDRWLLWVSFDNLLHPLYRCVLQHDSLRCMALIRYLYWWGCFLWCFELQLKLVWRLRIKATIRAPIQFTQPIEIFRLWVHRVVDFGWGYTVIKIWGSRGVSLIWLLHSLIAFLQDAQEIGSLA